MSMLPLEFDHTIRDSLHRRRRIRSLHTGIGVTTKESKSLGTAKANTREQAYIGSEEGMTIMVADH
jgi:hypothetical protein